VIKNWPGSWEAGRPDPARHEASLLNLAIDKAWHKLGWRPVWSFEACVRATIEDYREIASAPDRAREAVCRQIKAYERDARTAALAWTR
jgi:CDP-glucose 4,6-dehydratase